MVRSLVGMLAAAAVGVVISAAALAALQRRRRRRRRRRNSASSEEVETHILFYVNGDRHCLKEGDPRLLPHKTLLEYLRDDCGLRGCKLGCGVGACGACTVAIVTPPECVMRTVNACIFPLLLADGAHVITIEGIGSTSDPHPIQERVACFHGTQCGFCTPGVCTSIYAAVENGATSEGELERAVEGNLCRCTGYRPILDAAKSFAICDIEDVVPSPQEEPEEEWRPHHHRQCRDDDNASSCFVSNTADKIKTAVGLKSGPTVRPRLDFPDELRDRPRRPLSLKSPAKGTILPDGTLGRTAWIRPASLDDLVALCAELLPGARVVGGETDFTTAARLSATTFIDTTAVPEMNRVAVDLEAREGPILTFGSAVSVARAIESIDAALTDTAGEDLAPARRFRAQSARDALARLGTPQNRNSMCIGSHAGAVDLLPCLASLGATLRTAKSKRRVSVAAFFGVIGDEATTTATTTTAPGEEVILELSIPPPDDDAALEFCWSAKAAPRRTGAFGTVSAGFAVRFETNATAGGGCAAVAARIVLSGFSSPSTVDGAGRSSRKRTIRARAAEEALLAAANSDSGKEWGVDTYSAVAPTLEAVLLEEAPERANRDPLATEQFKRVLSLSLLLRFIATSAEWVQGVRGATDVGLPPEHRSAAVSVGDPGPSRGSQAWTTVQGHIQTTLRGPDAPHAPAPAATTRKPVGEPLRHAAALQQTTGEALYVADVEQPRDCLEAAIVGSAIPHGRVLGVDASPALAIPGVVAYFDHRDLADRAIKGKARVEDDKDRVFAEGLVTCVGMAIGIVVAESASLAQRAAKLVRVEYEELPPCLSIDDSVAQDRFHDYDHVVASGDVESALASAPHTLSGGLSVGAQEHFYMEPHALLAIPGETFGEMEIVSCTQCVTKTAKCVAGCLGVPEAKVRCVVKRLGGGFGGKETLSIFRAGAIAVAAAKTGRAVRWNSTREEDMGTSGQSHPFQGHWTVGFDGEGKIQAADVLLYNNAGASICCSNVVMDRGLAHFINAYDFGAVRCVGKLAWTHLPSNTAFRGFGVPQSALISEDMLEAVANHLGLAPSVVRERNLMPSGGRTPYGQSVPESHLPRIWRELHASAGLFAREDAAAAFNSRHRWKKRGLSIVPTMYGVNFPLKYLNQAGAQVLVYRDGSVLLTHAGVEMGQGLHTKCCQIAAQVFGIACEDVHVAETASDRVNNTSPTAASVGADLNGMATLNACEQIEERLRDIRIEFPRKSFAQVCEVAYKRQISLAAFGFYASPYGGVHNWRSAAAGEHLPAADRSVENNAERGDIFNYFSFGAAAAEVELDVLTGLFSVVRADILMDVGDSLNPAIDVGQVEGAFVQGMGRWTTEEMIFGDPEHADSLEPGRLFSDNPHRYFVPTAADVPRDLRVTLLGESRSPTAVHSSKAVGEPPFFLSSCVFFALKAAVAAARADAGLVGHCRIDAPLTTQRLRLACRDGMANCGGHDTVVGGSY